MSDLLNNINKMHTTIMGAERLRRNLGLKDNDAIEWCKSAVESAELIMQFGKNWYVYADGFSITINAKSFTIITAHKICGKARVMKRSDYPCLEEFLYQAIFIKKGEPLPPREIIKKPEIYIYIKDFGTLGGDFGVVAEQDGQVIGAAWTRIIPAYGHIDDFTPELAISILPEFRGFGIGTKLMKKLFILLKNKGYKKTSLSVQKQNRALKFYERLGYIIVNEKLDSDDHEDYLMVKDL